VKGTQDKNMRSIGISKLGAMFALTLLFSVNAVAQVRGGSGGSLIPQTAPGETAEGELPARPRGGIRMGPLVVYPDVSYQIHRNDNIFQQAPESGAVKSDSIAVLKLGAHLEGKQGPHLYTFGVATSLGRYTSSAPDNFNIFNTFARANLNPDTRVRIGLDADHTDGVDPRGSTNDPLASTPNRYRQDNLSGVVSYGAPGAQGRIDVALGGMAKRYVNNRESTFVNDRSENFLGGTYYWRIAPKTSLLAEIRRTNVDYTDPGSRLDSTEMRYLGGVTWEATALTTGIVKVGYLTKDFKDPATPGGRGLSWEAGVNWSPLTYSTWNFVTSKATRETTGNVGNFVLASNYLARWTHAWTDRISTTATGMYGIDDYKGIDRRDKIAQLGLGGRYQFRRWLSVGADYTRSTRSSSASSADFTKNDFMLFVDVNL